MSKKKQIKKTQTHPEHYVMAYETLFKFKWEVVHNYMKSVNWIWSGWMISEKTDNVPTIEDMKTKVETMMFECIGEAVTGIKSGLTNNNVFHEDGGFQIHITIVDGVILSISVNFLMESQKTYNYSD